MEQGETTQPQTAPAAVPIPERQKIKAKQRHKIIAEGEVYLFSTPEIIRAAKRKWGARSRRVTAVYDLLVDLIAEAGGKQ